MAEELKVVSRRYAGKPGVTWFILAMAGVRNAKEQGPWEYTFNDGYVFLPYPRSPMVKDWHYIIQGVSDVTGMAYQKYADAAGLNKPRRGRTPKPGHLINDREINQPANEEIALERIRNYSGPLNEDPNTWPEFYRKAWFERHTKAGKVKAQEEC